MDSNMYHRIPEEEMIEYAKKILKERGYKKKGTRWTKAEGEFTISFYLQGSSYAKENYYIRPGISLNTVNTDDHYGHFYTEIKQTTIENVFQEFDEFVNTWTNKERIKKIVEEFLEWDKRNPLEKRRAGEVDYEKDPVPSLVCFGIPQVVIKYILDNFE